MKANAKQKCDMIFIRGSMGMIATVTLSTALTDIGAEVMDVTAAAAQLGCYAACGLCENSYSINHG